jgi:hypothetical protein
MIRKTNAFRYVTTLAGARSESSGFPSALSLSLDKPTSITIDDDGILFFLNQGSNLKITHSANSFSNPNS